MTLKERIHNFKTNFGYIYWGADMQILSQCRTDKVKFVWSEILILLISVTSAFILMDTIFFRQQYLGIFAACIVFITYKWFLSSINLSLSKRHLGFLKWLVGTIIAAILWYFSLIECDIYVTSISGLLELVIAVIWGIIMLVICYIPIRFKGNKDSLYAQMFFLQQSQDRIRVELFINDHHQAEIEKHKKEIELQHQAHINYVSDITNKITIARLQLASQALKMWEEEQKLNIENGNNLEQFLSFKPDNKSKKSSSLTAAEQEVIDKGQTKYVTKLSQEIAEARLRLAMLAIAKWEEEQTKKIEDNVETYINA